MSLLQTPNLGGQSEFLKEETQVQQGEIEDFGAESQRQEGETEDLGNECRPGLESLCPQLETLYLGLESPDCEDEQK